MASIFEKHGRVAERCLFCKAPQFFSLGGGGAGSKHGLLRVRVSAHATGRHQTEHGHEAGDETASSM